jgi:hypothetical protein
MLSPLMPTSPNGALLATETTTMASGQRDKVVTIRAGTQAHTMTRHYQSPGISPVKVHNG